MITIKNHIEYKKILVIALAALLVAGGITGLILRRGSGDAIIDVLSLLATLIGTVFIAVELKNSQVVTCCDMLIQLNNYFHDSTPIMNVYEALEKEHAGDNSADLWADVRDTDVAAYCTFFENIYLLVNNKIAKMENIDALYGYRFFLFANNKRIQERYILPTSSSYSEIFELYAIWKQYRKKAGKESMTVNRENEFSDEYLNNKIYLNDRGHTGRIVKTFSTEKAGEFTVKEATFADLTNIEKLQNGIAAQITNNDIYSPLSRAELMESMHLDHVYCVCSKDKLAAFAVVVSNRKTNRNLYNYCKEICPEHENVITFDAVAVAPEFRGNGIQNQIIAYAIDEAKKNNAIKYIAATVSPANKHSMSNFEKNQFVVRKKDLLMYGGVKRSLLLSKLGYSFWRKIA